VPDDQPAQINNELPGTKGKSGRSHLDEFSSL
jgi:hypothetical protein